MKAIGRASRVVVGHTVIERLAGLSPPAELQPHIDAFQQEHSKYEVAYQATGKAEERRDDALAAIGQADSKLDVALEELALCIVTARKGDRRKPLARYTTHNMSRLTNLAYAKEVEEVEQICANIVKDEPTEQISAAVAQCLQHAAGVKTALSNLSAPIAEYQNKLEARDALVADWERAYAKLQAHAAVVWVSQPKTLKAIFAPPEPVQQPVTRRGKKKDEGTPDDPEGAAL